MGRAATGNGRAEARVTAILGAVTGGGELRIMTPPLDQISPGPGEVVFIQTEELESRAFGAVVDDEATAERLVELVRKRVPNTRPRLLCARPLPTEVLKP